MDRKTWGIILLFGFILGAVLVVFEFIFKIINLKYFYFTLPLLLILLTIMVRIHQILWVRKKYFK